MFLALCPHFLYFLHLYRRKRYNDNNNNIVNRPEINISRKISPSFRGNISYQNQNVLLIILPLFFPFPCLHIYKVSFIE